MEFGLISVKNATNLTKERIGGKGVLIKKNAL